MSAYSEAASALLAGSKQMNSYAKNIAASATVAGPSFNTYLTTANVGVNTTTVRDPGVVGKPVEGRELNIALEGKGFFVVRDLPGNTADGRGVTGFTRDGTFETDAAGNVVNHAGQFLQVALLDPATGRPMEGGNILEDLVTLNINSLSQGAEATSRIDVRTQLSAEADVNHRFTQTINVYDSLGTHHPLNLQWERIDTPTPPHAAGATQYWQMTASTPDGTVAPGGNGFDYSSNGGLVISFNASGRPVQWGANAHTQLPQLNITWNRGTANASNIALNLGTIGQDDGLVSVGNTSQIIAAPTIDGSSAGFFKKACVGDDGIVTISFTNDRIIKYARIPVAHVANPSGLDEIRPGVYTPSGSSGHYQMSFPGVGSTASIIPGMYEVSANDGLTNYTRMMEVLRYIGYNSKSFYVADKAEEKLDKV